jgi:hypothetical protein
MHTLFRNPKVKSDSKSFLYGISFLCVGAALGKTIEQTIEKLSRACGAIGKALGLDGKKIQESVSKNLTSVKEGFEDLAFKLKDVAKNPVTAFAASGIAVASIPVAEKLNQSGLNLLGIYSSLWVLRQLL